MYSIGGREMYASNPIESLSLSRLERSLLRLWRTPGLNRLLRGTIDLLPGQVKHGVSRARARVQDVELDEQIRTRPRLVPEENLRALLSRGLGALMERHGRDGIGAYLEFGVYNGTSLICMYRELAALGLDHVRLFGFDSFEGFPANAAVEDGGRWRPGRCRSDLSFTTAVLQHEAVDLSRVTLVPGWFRDTLTPGAARDLGITKASVIMIDCDLYSSTKEALDFCEPLIQDEALVLFDEWHARGLAGRNMGERRAFMEFLSRHRSLTATPFGQYARRTETFLVSRR